MCSSRRRSRRKRMQQCFCNLFARSMAKGHVQDHSVAQRKGIKIQAILQEEA